MARKPETESPAEPEEVRRGWFGVARRRPVAGETPSADAAPPPPPKRRKGGLVGLFSGLLTVALILVIGAASIFAYGQKEMVLSGPLVADKSIIIERGVTTEEIVEQLEKEGIIARPGLFWAVLRWQDMISKFAKDETARKNAKSGEYLFRRQASMNEVLDIITSGRAVEHTITIPEGLTSEQIVERLKENELLTGEVGEVPLEGSLLPDTYKINRGTSRTALIGRMQREQKRLVNEIWNRRAKDLTTIKNPRELVTLASIVEKETGRADERNRVAGVFHNRLEKKMRLQSDPTITYGIVGGKPGGLGRPISRADIDRPTPYNTYTINGLPPGPIANPGRASMEATANPSRTKELFFVADGTGGHAFAETLEQHNRNVMRWRQIEAQRGPASPASGNSVIPGASAFQPVPGAPDGATTPGSAPAGGFAVPLSRGTVTPPSAPRAPTPIQ